MYCSALLIVVVACQILYSQLQTSMVWRVGDSLKQVILCQPKKQTLAKNNWKGNRNSFFFKNAIVCLQSVYIYTQKSDYIFLKNMFKNHQIYYWSVCNTRNAKANSCQLQTCSSWRGGMKEGLTRQLICFLTLITFSLSLPPPGCATKLDEMRYISNDRIITMDGQRPAEYTFFSLTK